MKAKFVVSMFIAAAGVLAARVLAPAQVTSSNSQAAALEKQGPKPHPRKAGKIWTNDEVRSLRSPADIYTEEKEAQAAAAVASTKLNSANERPAPASPPQGGGPPALANPKTVDETDKMIDWENRDIAAQEEMVTRCFKSGCRSSPTRAKKQKRLLQGRKNFRSALRLAPTQSRKSIHHNSPFPS
jgi:hypothetical protein